MQRCHLCVCMWGHVCGHVVMHLGRYTTCVCMCVCVCLCMYGGQYVCVCVCGGVYVWWCVVWCVCVGGGGGMCGMCVWGHVWS